MAETKCGGSFYFKIYVPKERVEKKKKKNSEKKKKEKKMKKKKV